MLYLSSPYSHPDPAVRQSRYEAACRATATLMRHKLLVFSPIVYSHPLVADWGVEDTHKWWLRFDAHILFTATSRLLVLQLDGWEESEGVANEIGMAEDHDLLIQCATPDEIESYAKHFVPTPDERWEIIS